MAQKRLLTNGNAFKRTDDRWCGVVWYMDEQEQRKRKSFSGTTKAEVNKKMTDYIAEFNKQILQSDEARRTVQESMQHWLQVFKFPSVERTTYDRYECTARHQIYPLIGEKVVGDIKAADLKKLLNHWMNEGYAYTTVKKVHMQLKEFFRYLVEQEVLYKNPMNSVPMIKKANYFAAQNTENLAECDAITVFTPEEIELFKAECFRTWSNGKRIYQQVGAYILMLNTGLRTGEMLGILNSDVDLENKVLHVRQGVKEIYHRNGLNIDSGRDVKVGKLKSATSKRDVPLNATAIEMIEDLRREYYFGPCTPPCLRREWGLYAAGELPETLLPDPGGSWHPEEGPPRSAPHLCHQSGERCKAAGRQHQVPDAAPGGGSPGPQHIPDHGDVLREAGQQQTGGCDGCV